jgi:hypothetical protein
MEQLVYDKPGCLGAFILKGKFGEVNQEMGNRHCQRQSPILEIPYQQKYKDPMDQNVEIQLGRGPFFGFLFSNP